MQAFIKQPERIPVFSQTRDFDLGKSDWEDDAPRADFGLVPQGRHRIGSDGGPGRARGREMTPRMLEVVRMTASDAAVCPFCIDMNSHEYRQHGITDEEAGIPARRFRAGEYLFRTREAGNCIYACYLANTVEIPA